MKVFSGSSNGQLATKIGEKLGIGTTGNIEITKFPDGEIHVKFVDNIRGKDVFLVQSITTPVNDNLMELLIMIDAARRASARRITAVIPYYAYARQDRKDQARVPITAKLVANMLVASGANRILTMDLHSPQIQGFFDIPVDHLTALPLFVNAIKFARSQGYVDYSGFDLNNLVSVAPDVGRSKIALQYAKALGCKFAIVSKERVDAETVESNTIVGDVKGKTALIIDDMSSTGGTLIAAADIVMANGAKNVLAGITHNLLTDKGVKKLTESFIDKLMITDTTFDTSTESYLSSSDNKVIKVSAADMFANAINAIHNDESVSSLFKV
jgi:ribose-phosphate pyrophosphokinase